MALENETAVFNSKRSEWLPKFEGRFVAIQDENILGFTVTWEEALRGGFKAFGCDRPFLVKEILENDRVYFIGSAA